MEGSFYLKNGAVLLNGAFVPADLAVEDGKITAVTQGLSQCEKSARAGRRRTAGGPPASWTSTPTAPPGWT